MIWKPTLIMFGFIAAAYLLGNLDLNIILLYGYYPKSTHILQIVFDSTNQHI